MSTVSLNTEMKKALKKVDVEGLIDQITLTSLKAWDVVVTREDINKWLNNFKGEYFETKIERTLALLLLSQFVYYNHEEVKHLCKTIYSKLVHYSVKTNTQIANNEDPIRELLRITRFYHLGKTGESSAFILYFFRQVNELPIKRFLPKINAQPEDVQYIVFIDDVTLSDGEEASGKTKNQAYKYIKKLLEDEPKLNEKKLILLTFISSGKAFDYLKSKGITNISAIQLSNKDKCFNKSSMAFTDLEALTEPCKQMSEYYGKKLEPYHPLGYKDGQYLFSFFYNTPDNTLPIFWSSDENWTPIFIRHKKKYDNGRVKQLGRFI